MNSYALYKLKKKNFRKLTPMYSIFITIKDLTMEIGDF